MTATPAVYRPPGAHADGSSGDRSSRSRPGRQVVVIGAGLGGLGAAIRLRCAGYRVRVLETHPWPGGRCGRLDVDGFAFDTGPTLLLMVDLLRELFQDAGARLEDYLELIRLDPSYRIVFPDGETLEVSSRIDDLVRGVERFERGAGRQLLGFLATTGRFYDAGVDRFVRRPMHRPSDFFNPRNAALLGSSGAPGGLRRLVSRHFRSERLRDAFSFQSLYLGLSPFDSPAIYGLLAYTEIAGGLYFPRGGMRAIPDALAALAVDLGVEIEYGAEVVRVERSARHVHALELADGRRVPGDVVLANADLGYVYQDLLGEKLPVVGRPRFSCSAYLLFLGVDGSYPELGHHTLVVSDSLRGTCRDLFSRGAVPDDLSLYLCNPNKTDSSLAPAGCENLYVLAPVPHHEPRRPIDWSREGPRLEERILERLEGACLPGVAQRIRVRRAFTPVDFSRRLHATRGEAFGLAHTLGQVGYFRPRNRHARLTNLYFVGQGTHPGCGIPMVLASARHAAARIAGEHAVS